MTLKARSATVKTRAPQNPRTAAMARGTNGAPEFWYTVVCTSEVAIDVDINVDTTTGFVRTEMLVAVDIIVDVTVTDG